jgi:hypothetical protein
MVVQQRLGVVNLRLIGVALVILGMLVLGGLTLFWISASSSSSSVNGRVSVQAFPLGPADRSGADESAVRRAADADSQRYAAQVPAALSPAPSNEAGTSDIEPLRTSGPR